MDKRGKVNGGKSRLTFYNISLKSRIFLHKTHIVMSFSKAHHFKPHLYYFSLLCRALAHPARLSILRKIIDTDNDWVTAGDLGLGLPISQQATSQHLKVLRDMYILDFSEDVPFVHYRINNDMPGIKKGICNLVYQSDPERLKAFENEINFLSKRRRSEKKAVQNEHGQVWVDR